MTTTKKNPILIDIPMPIETDRLILRNVMPENAAALHEAKAETFNMLNKWMPWAKELGTIEETQAAMTKAHEEFKTRKDIMIVGFKKSKDGNAGRVIIGTGLHRIDWEKRTFEIGFWVRASAQGKGYATESTNALIRYAFNALSATIVTICHADGNDASRTVIERLGFTKTHTQPRDEPLNDGTVVNTHWYERRNTDGLPPLNILKWG